MAGSRNAGGQREVVATAASITLGNNDIGKIITTRGASGAVTVTLPTPSMDNAGGSVTVLNVVDQNLTVNCSTNDLVMIINDAAADSVSLQTASQKIGGGFDFISDGTNWFVNLRNPTGGTLTVTTAT